MSTQRIGLGTFSFANVFSQLEEKEASEIIHVFLDLGGKFIQTAPYYKGVEDLLGRILKGIPRDKYYISTSGVKNNEGVCDWRQDAIIQQCDASLKRLGIDHIDLFLTSEPNPDNVPFEETMDAMRLLKKQGKITSIGAANVSLAGLKRQNEMGDVSFVQNRFSLLNRTFDDEFNLYCKEHEIHYIPYEIIERGILTDKGMELFAMGENDFRRRKPEFRDEVRVILRDWVKEYLFPIAQSINTSIEGLAIWWALQQPNMGVCIIGATNHNQVKKNMAAIDIQPKSDTMSLIEKSYRELEAKIENLYPTTIQKFMRVRYRP